LIKTEYEIKMIELEKRFGGDSEAGEQAIREAKAAANEAAMKAAAGEAAVKAAAGYQQQIE
jgi:hypothetical protein